MTFPTVAGRTNSVVITDGTSHSVSLPTAATINAGDLLVVHFVADGVPAITWPANWVGATPVTHGGGANVASSSTWAYKIADGTEGASISVTTDVSEKSAHRAWHIQDWHGTTVPEATSATGNDANPDPPNLSPSWGAEDTAWLVLSGHENSQTPVNAYPTNYTDTFTQNTVGGGGSAATNVVQGVAERQLNAASEDPGTFTLSGSRLWAAFTVAVRPAAAVNVDGVLDSTLPAITADFAGTVPAPVSGTLTDTLPAITADMTGSIKVAGALSDSLPAITADMSGSIRVAGALADSLPAITADFTGTTSAGGITGTLTVTLPAFTNDVAGTTGNLWRVIHPAFEGPRLSHPARIPKLWVRVEGTQREHTIWKKNGDWHSGDATGDDLEGADFVFLGGHENIVNDIVKAELTAEGFSTVFYA